MQHRSPRPAPLLALAFVLLCPILTTLGASGPVEELLARIPKEAGFTVVVEDLRGRWVDVFRSPIADSVRNLPISRAFFASDRWQEWKKARSRLEMAFGMDLKTIRDDLAGDALVLAAVPPAMGSPAETSGLLLTRFHDRKTLNRLIDSVNKSEIRDKTLVEVVELPAEQGLPPRWHRRFAPGGKPDEWYAIDGHVFAWSNSENLLRRVIGPPDAREGLTSNLRFRAVREGLPTHSLFQIYLDPRFLERVADAQPGGPHFPPDSPPRRLISALNYAGAALEWRDGPVAHFHETFDASRLPAAFQPQMAPPHPAGDVLRSVPETSLLIAMARIDPASLYDLYVSGISEKDRPGFDLLLTAIRGFLLGKDPRTEILPFVDHNLVGWVDLPRPADPASFSTVLTVGLPGSARAAVSEALANAARTFFALIVLDGREKQPDNPPTLETVPQAGATTATIHFGPRALSLGVRVDRLALANGVEGIVAAMSGPRDVSPESRKALTARILNGYFPRASGFAILDLVRVQKAAKLHLDRIASRLAAARNSPPAAVRRDLSLLLQCLSSFDGAFVAWMPLPDRSSAHQMIGLVKP